MRIAIASGKGGTGKTTLAVNLAARLTRMGRSVAYLDCDVEEPNGHLFLKPDLNEPTPVPMAVPQVDPERCNHCGVCTKACRFHAILALADQVLTFPKLCHGCGNCMLSCPEKAITESNRPIGSVSTGVSQQVKFFAHGQLTIGEAMAPPIIRQVLETGPPGLLQIVDAPPGTSCPAVEAIRGADVVLLVTEPTPFGLHDLKLAVEMVRQMDIPHGVLINRAGIGDLGVEEYCRQENIPILCQIPDSRHAAVVYARGDLLIDHLPELETTLDDLAEQLLLLAESPAPACPPVQKPPAITGSQPAKPSERKPGAAASRVDELIVISGKGGTGKTSITASLAVLASNPVLADCDVDAADLHLVLRPTVIHRWSFAGGFQAGIDPDRCTACGVCAEHCRFDALSLRGQTYHVDPAACEGCGVCVDVCPESAAILHRPINGTWFESTTRAGPLIHARLDPAQENSGKLVTLLRQESRALAEQTERRLVIVDGSPGIGCPVMASITGARLVLVVTEPTLSGIHDLQRVLDLIQHFKLSAGLCINKWDIHPEMSARLEQLAADKHLPVWGKIRYDAAVTQAQVQARAVVEGPDNPVTADMKSLWEGIQHALR